jgi:hypothetical protein
MRLLTITAKPASAKAFTAAWKTSRALEPTRSALAASKVAGTGGFLRNISSAYGRRTLLIPSRRIVDAMSCRCCTSSPPGMKSSSLAPYQLMEASLTRAPLLSRMYRPCVCRGSLNKGAVISDASVNCPAMVFRLGYSSKFARPWLYHSILSSNKYTQPTLMTSARSARCQRASTWQPSYHRRG